MHVRDRATKHERQGYGEKDFADDFCFHVSYSIIFVYMFVCMCVCNNVVRRSIHSYRIGKVIFQESDLLLSQSRRRDVFPRAL